MFCWGSCPWSEVLSSLKTMCPLTKQPGGDDCVANDVSWFSRHLDGLIREGGRSLVPLVFRLLGFLLPVEGKIMVQSLTFAHVVNFQRQTRWMLSLWLDGQGDHGSHHSNKNDAEHSGDDRTCEAERKTRCEEGFRAWFTQKVSKVGKVQILQEKTWCDWKTRCLLTNVGVWLGFIFFTFPTCTTWSIAHKHGEETSREPDIPMIIVSAGVSAPLLPSELCTYCVLPVSPQHTLWCRSRPSQTCFRCRRIQRRGISCISHERHRSSTSRSGPCKCLEFSPAGKHSSLQTKRKEFMLFVFSFYDSRALKDQPLHSHRFSYHQTSSLARSFP